MMIKGKWKDYYFRGLFILVVILDIHPACKMIKGFCSPYVYHRVYISNLIVNAILALFVSLIIAMFIFVVLFALTVLFLQEPLNRWLNVKIRTAKIQEDIKEYKVMARFAGYKAKGILGFTGSYESFSIKIQLDEGVYYTFHNVEDYAAVKEGEMAKVKVKLYIDTEGDVFYIEPLNIIGGYKENTEKSTEVKSITS